MRPYIQEIDALYYHEDYKSSAQEEDTRAYNSKRYKKALIITGPDTAYIDKRKVHSKEKFNPLLHLNCLETATLWVQLEIRYKMCLHNGSCREVRLVRLSYIVGYRPIDRVERVTGT